MALSGDLKSVSLPTLFQMFEGDRKTGILSLTVDKIQRKLFLINGKIIFLLSDDPRDMLGHFLVSKGLISEEYLLEALNEQSKSKDLLGEIISKIADVSKEHIEIHVRQKIKESIYQIFLIDNADFEFIETEITLDDFPEMDLLDIKQILMEGMRRFDEFKVLRDIFPTNELSFKVHQDKIGSEVKENKKYSLLLSQIAKGCTIHNMCLYFHTYEYPILKNLKVLLDKGIIEPSALASIEANTSKNLDPKSVLIQLAEKEEKSNNITRVFEIYTDLLKIDPNDPVIRKKYLQIQEVLAEKPLREISEKAVYQLRESIDLSSCNISTSEGFILSRLNGQWTVGEIKSIVPIPEEEVNRSLSHLLDEEIIEQVQ